MNSEEGGRKGLLTTEYRVKCDFGWTFSTPFRPGSFDHSAGGCEPSGKASRSRVMEAKFWRRRMSMNDISLYAN